VGTSDVLKRGGGKPVEECGIPTPLFGAKRCSAWKKKKKVVGDTPVAGAAEEEARNSVKPDANKVTCRFVGESSNNNNGG